MARTASQVGKSNVSCGKAFERQVAKILTDLTGQVFRRRRVEGRDTTTIDRDFTSDVIPASVEPEYSIEVKNGKGFSVAAMFTNRETNKFTCWWHQANYDAKLATEAVGRSIAPMLFFRPTPQSIFVAVPVDHVSRLFGDVELSGIKYCEYEGHEIGMNVVHTKNSKNKNVVKLELRNVFILPVQSFLKMTYPTLLYR